MRYGVRELSREPAQNASAAGPLQTAGLSSSTGYPTNRVFHERSHLWPY
jgi:hypothetical protein